MEETTTVYSGTADVALTQQKNFYCAYCFYVFMMFDSAVSATLVRFLMLCVFRGNKRMTYLLAYLLTYVYVLSRWPQFIDPHQISVFAPQAMRSLIGSSLIGWRCRRVSR